MSTTVTTAADTRNGLATAGFVLAVIGAVLSPVPIINNVAAILGVLGIIFGAIGLAKALKGGEHKGLAIAALVLGVLAIVITLVLQAQWSSELDALALAF